MKINLYFISIILVSFCGYSNAMENGGERVISDNGIQAITMFDLTTKGYLPQILACIRVISASQSRFDLRHLEKLVALQCKTLGFCSDFLESVNCQCDGIEMVMGHVMEAHNAEVVTMFNPTTVDYVSKLIPIVREISAAPQKIDLRPLEELEARQCKISRVCLDHKTESDKQDSSFAPFVMAEHDY